jgi:hypothetical protein
MSVHVEWISAEARVTLIPPHHYLDGVPEDHDGPDCYEDSTADNHCIVLDSGDCVAILGSPEQLRDLFQRALAALPATEPEEIR